MRGAGLALFLLSMGCAAASAREPVRLAATIRAEATGRFAGPPVQADGDCAIHVEADARVPDGFAREAAETMRRFAALLEVPLRPGTPVRVLVYASPSRLQAALGVSAGVHGLALPQADAPLIVLASGDGDDALRRHLRHELAHVVADLPHGGPAGDAAAWVDEGLAYLLEWSDDDAAPQPAAALLAALGDNPPDPGDVPALVTAHYRPEGDVRTMRRLAAATALLLHFQWDRAARLGPIRLPEVLANCAALTPEALHRDAAAVRVHARRLWRLGMAAEAAAVAAVLCADAADGLRDVGATAGAEAAAEAAVAARGLRRAARAAGAPGGALDPAAAPAARRALEALAPHRDIRGEAGLALAWGRRHLARAVAGLPPPEPADR